MVRLMGGCTEDAECRVALELVDPTAFSLDAVDDGSEERIEERDDVDGGSRLCELGRPDEIDEEYARLTAFPAEADSLFSCEARDVHADVAAEEVLQLASVSQAGDHLVVARLQQPHLRCVVH